MLVTMLLNLKKHLKNIKKGPAPLKEPAPVYALYGAKD
jgi:hypothetical protein